MRSRLNIRKTCKRDKGVWVQLLGTPKESNEGGQAMKTTLPCHTMARQVSYQTVEQTNTLLHSQWTQSYNSVAW